MAKYTLPDLPYDYAALEPHISGKIMELHHSKHHQAYVTGANTALEQLAEARDSGNLANVNKLEKDLAFNLGGHVNHSIFWTNLSPEGGGEPEGELKAAIDEFFGGFDKFQAHFTAAATGIQGSGWAVLSWDVIGEQLIIQQLFDQQSNTAQGTVPGLPARHVGARLLPRLPQRQGRLRQGRVEHRELAERRAVASMPPARRLRACWYCHNQVRRPGGTPAGTPLSLPDRNYRALAHDISQGKFRGCQDRDQRLRPYRT